MTPSLVAFDAAERDRRVRILTTTLAVVVPVAYLVVGLLRAYPFVDDVQIPAVHPDDWHTYKRLAVSVLQGGLSMPGVQSSYTGLPHGFLYIYFLALVFALAGVNSAYVYVVQSLIAGLSVSLTWLAIRRHLTVRGGLTFLLALTALTYVDVFQHLTFKLLSENLYLLLAPPLFIVLFRSVEEQPLDSLDAFLTGSLLGLVVLTRPSFLGSAAAVLATLGCAAAARRMSFRSTAFTVAGFALFVSVIGIRNFAASSHVTFDLVTDRFDWFRPWQLPLGQAVSALTTRALFIFGWTHMLAPAYRVRFYWAVLWILWVVFPIVRVRARRALDWSDYVAYAYVIGYVGPLLLIAPDIGSYGGRMVVVILPILLMAALRLFSARDQPSPQSVSELEAQYVRH